MKRFGAVLVVVAGLLLAAAPAGAQTTPDPSRLIGPFRGGPRVFPVENLGNPVQSCLASNNTLLEETPFGPQPQEFPSLAACVSSLALGRVSWLAYYQNCQQLERTLFVADNPSGQPYPYSFYGNPNYTAHNRFDCIFFIWSFHTGQLPPGPPNGA